MQSETLDALESIIDSSGLSETLAALAEICHGKADHLRANWQDSASAKVWERAAKRIDKAAAEIDI